MLALRLPPPSRENLLTSILGLLKVFKSILLRTASELVLLISVLARGLKAPLVGNKEALTLSSKKGVGVLFASSRGDRGSLGDCTEGRFKPAAFGLGAPSVIDKEDCSKSSGIFWAMVSSTRILRTFNASLPKLKKEKKY